MNATIQTIHAREILDYRGHRSDYFPDTVAEHTAGSIFMLDRKLYRADNPVRDDNFSLEGLLGFDLHGRTVGIFGTGKKGIAFARIMQGFGCTLLGYNVYPNEEFEAIANARYVALSERFADADIIILHCPLLLQTHPIINREATAQMKPGVMLISTSRGLVIDTAAAIEGIKSEQIGYLGIDVYEQETGLFVEDLSDTVIQIVPEWGHDCPSSLLNSRCFRQYRQHPLSKITDFEQGQPLKNEVAIDPFPQGKRPFNSTLTATL